MKTATILIIEDDDLQYEIYEDALSDYKLVRVLSLRVEGDYIHTDLFNTPQNNVRISTGLAVHF